MVLFSILREIEEDTFLMLEKLVCEIVYNGSSGVCIELETNDQRSSVRFIVNQLYKSYKILQEIMLK